MPRMPKPSPAPTLFTKKRAILFVLALISVLEIFRFALFYYNGISSVSATKEVESRELQGNSSEATLSVAVAVAISDATSAASPTDVSPEKPLIKSEKNTIAKNPNRDIVFVHVGKAGGKSIRQNVAAGCEDQWKMNKAECFATFPKEEPLANQTRNVIHMWGLKPEAVDNASSFLVNLRNPVDRIVSAYRHTHPANCRPGISHNYACTMKKQGKYGPKGQPHYLFKECFPSAAMEDMAQAVQPPYNTSNNQHFLQSGFTPEQQCQCRKSARLALQADPEHAWVSPHMLYNYNYYGQLSFNKYPDKEIFAIRTENEYEDMVALDQQLGGTGQFKYPNNHFSHGSENYLPSPLTSQAYQKLCCVLEQELHIYFDVFARALNMNPQNLLEAKNAMRHKCGLALEQSWTDWRTQCRAKLAEPMGC